MSTSGNVLSAMTEHPSFAPESCINHRQRRYACTVCSAVCPKGVFSLNAGEHMKWDHCIDCGLCVAACPSRCFLPSPSAQRSYSEELDLSGPLTLACREEEEHCALRVRCLAAVPWELLALIAMQTELVLYIGHCSSCAHPEWAGCVREQLALVREFLGEERWSRQVHVLTEGRFEAPKEAAKEEQSLTRREFFSGMKRRMVKGIYKAASARLSFLAEDTADPMQYRRTLASAVLAEQKRAQEAAEAKERAPDYGVQVPRFTADCYGCGICEKLCPPKAIEIGPEKDGKRLIYLTPWKCTGCSLCMRVCPHGGISGLHSLRVPGLTQLALVRVEGTSCERCGMPIPPGSKPPLCPACAAKAGRWKR